MELKPKYLLGVIPTGQDVMGEVLFEDDKVIHFKNPRLVGADPQARKLIFINFAPHSIKGQPIVVSKTALLATYTPNPQLVAMFEDAARRESLNEKGIIIP